MPEKIKQITKKNSDIGQTDENMPDVLLFFFVAIYFEEIIHRGFTLQQFPPPGRDRPSRQPLLLAAVDRRFIGLECGADVQTFLFQGSSFRCAVGQDDIHQLFISDLNAAGPQSFCGRNTYDFCKEFPDTSVTKKQCVGAADAVGGCNGAGQAVFVFAQLVQQQAGVVIGFFPGGIHPHGDEGQFFGFELIFCIFDGVHSHSPSLGENRIDKINIFLTKLLSTFYILRLRINSCKMCLKQILM